MMHGQLSHQQTSISGHRNGKYRLQRQQILSKIYIILLDTQTESCDDVIIILD